MWHLASTQVQHTESQPTPKTQLLPGWALRRYTCHKKVTDIADGQSSRTAAMDLKRTKIQAIDVIAGANHQGIMRIYVDDLPFYMARFAAMRRLLASQAFG